MSVMTKLMHK